LLEVLPQRIHRADQQERTEQEHEPDFECLHGRVSFAGLPASSSSRMALYAAIAALTIFLRLRPILAERRSSSM
jgi:hypothetical protein